VRSASAKRVAIALTAIPVSFALLLSTAGPVPAMPAYQQTNLVSDGFVPAPVIDPNLKNPWGMSFGPTTPFWVSDQAVGNATLYTGSGQIVPLVVTIPQAAAGPAGPTGQVFNGTTDFILPNQIKGLFFFANLDGSISGWNQALGSTAVQVVASSPTAIYTGLAIGGNASGNFLYAANGLAGAIDVFDASFAPVTLAGTFTDPSVPAGLAPFNIQNLGGELYVAYAPPGPEADEAPVGTGAVSVFNTSGQLLRSLVNGGPLGSPWGLALAPGNFGLFSNALLVGNFNDEDGVINAFDPLTGAFLGTIRDGSGQPIANPDLWALAFGTGAANSGKTDELFFTAGVGDEEHGLFGKITATGLPPSLALLVVGAGATAAMGVRQRGRHQRRRPLHSQGICARRSWWPAR
jgi:uncharacterized protein (TIGR03118 family)